MGTQKITAVFDHQVTMQRGKGGGKNRMKKAGIASEIREEESETNLESRPREIS